MTDTVRMKLYDLQPSRGFDEAAATRAIANTKRPIPLIDRSSGAFDTPRVLGRITNMAVEDGAVWGDVEFLGMSGEMLTGEAARMLAVSLEPTNG